MCSYLENYHKIKRKLRFCKKKFRHLHLSSQSICKIKKGIIFFLLIKGFFFSKISSLLKNKTIGQFFRKLSPGLFWPRCIGKYQTIHRNKITRNTFFVHDLRNIIGVILTILLKNVDIFHFSDKVGMRKNVAWSFLENYRKIKRK